MGARLVRDVIRTMPIDIRPTERYLLVVLADAIDDHTREGRFPGGRAALCERMGVSEAALKRSFHRLAELGYELRITIGKNRNDEGVVAVTGTSTTYRIPVFRPP